jgi:hypothetical protein
MDRDRTRVLGLLVVYLVLVVVSLFVLDWFVAAMPFGKLTVDLRSAQVCSGDGICDSFSISQMRGSGFYAPLAGLTFFGTILFSLLVGYQAITRIATGFASESLSKLGYLGGMLLFGTAGAAAFLFGPESSSIEQAMLGIEVQRTSAPFLMLLAHMLGIAVMYYAVTQHSGDDVGQYKPVAPIGERKTTGQIPPITAAPKKHESSPPAAALEKHPSQPPASALKKHESSPPASAVRDRKTTPPGSGPVSTVPEHLRKKLKFVALTAELTRAGINARREDGTTNLVMWRDVVGFVVRRMPAEHDGLVFLDVVSTPGSTVRLLPWTRLTGETIEGEGDAWHRALLKAMMTHCPAASLDPATKRFHGGEPAAQLPDVTKLAAHDGKLA